MQWKQLKCLAQTEDHRTCGAYLGDIQSGVPTTVRPFCHKHKKHASRDRIEFTQTSDGVVLYREIPESEKVDYDDNNVRIHDASNPE